MNLGIQSKCKFRFEQSLECVFTNSLGGCRKSFITQDAQYTVRFEGARYIGWYQDSSIHGTTEVSRLHVVQGKSKSLRCSVPRVRYRDA